MKGKKIDETLVPGGDISNAANYISNLAAQNPYEGATLLNKDLLPSKGKFYTNDLYIKKLSTIDLKNLTRMTVENANGVINGVLAKCILGMPVNKLQVGDKLWFLFYLRFFTYDDLPYNVKYECSECGHKGSVNVTMKDIDCSYLKDEFNDEITLPSGDVVKFMFPTIEREIQAQRLTKDDNIIEDIDDELIDVACYISDVNGEHKSLMSAYEYLCNMTAKDFSVFANTVADYTFGIKPIAHCQCTCGNVEDTKFSFTSEFFMPKFA